MEQILVVAILTCLMTTVASVCEFTEPCKVAAADRKTCGDAGISKFACICRGCCYDDSDTSCYAKASICNVMDKDLTVECPGGDTKFVSRNKCRLPNGHTCGIGELTETWDCQSGGGTVQKLFLRCCCDTPCPGANKCGIPLSDRTACTDKTSADIKVQAECFIAGCCFEDGSVIPCYEPNPPLKITCGMVYPGC